MTSPAATSHLPLVQSVAAKLDHRLPRSGAVGREDYIQAGTVGLLEAVERFHPESGYKFSTYAVRRIAGAMLDEARKVRARSRYGVRRGDREGRGVAGLSVADRSTPDPSDRISAEDERAHLAIVLETLPPRELAVIRAVYFHGRMLKDVGAELGVTESRACQLHTSALRRMRGGFAWLSA